MVVWLAGIRRAGAHQLLPLSADVRHARRFRLRAPQRPPPQGCAGVGLTAAYCGVTADCTIVRYGTAASPVRHHAPD